MGKGSDRVWARVWAKAQVSVWAQILAKACVNVWVGFGQGSGKSLSEDLDQGLGRFRQGLGKDSGKGFGECLGRICQEFRQGLGQVETSVWVKVQVRAQAGFGQRFRHGLCKNSGARCKG